MLHTAARNGIRLTLSLSDYHSRFGQGQAGIEPYLQWVLGSFNLTGAIHRGQAAMACHAMHTLAAGSRWVCG